jgi:hypothetical protein
MASVGSIILGAAQPLRRPTSLLGSEPAFVRSAARPGGATLPRRRGDGLGQDRGHPDERRFPVAKLGAMFGRRDREHTADEPVAQTIQGSGS